MAYLIIKKYNMSKNSTQIKITSTKKDSKFDEEMARKEEEEQDIDFFTKKMNYGDGNCRHILNPIKKNTDKKVVWYGNELTRNVGIHMHNGISWNALGDLFRFFIDNDELDKEEKHRVVDRMQATFNSEEYENVSDVFNSYFCPCGDSGMNEPDFDVDWSDDDDDSDDEDWNINDSQQTVINHD
jgi:hypothetical protein